MMKANSPSVKASSAPHVTTTVPPIRQQAFTSFDSTRNASTGLFTGRTATMRSAIRRTRATPAASSEKTRAACKCLSNASPSCLSSANDMIIRRRRPCIGTDTDIRARNAAVVTLQFGSGKFALASASMKLSAAGTAILAKSNSSKATCHFLLMKPIPPSLRIC